MKLGFALAIPKRTSLTLAALVTLVLMGTLLSDTPGVSAQTNSPATGQPTISGTAQVSETLTTDTSGISDDDGLTNPTFNYQWIRSDGTTDTDIAGATSTTYLVTTDDVGKTIKVRVSFADDAENQESLTSAATAAVAARVPGAPNSVEVQRGGTGELDVSWEAPASNGGSAITGYTVQWKEAADNWDTPADVSEATTTGTSHTISRLSLGTEYSVRVIATNSVGDGPASAEVTETADAQTSQQQSATQNTQGTQEPKAYITVMIQSGDDSVSWSDPDECSSEYNMYLAVTPPSNDAETSRTHLGASASGSDQTTLSITYSTGGGLPSPQVEVELYCGEYESSSDQNNLVASTELAYQHTELRAGTYSSAPLTELTVSTETLSPSFNQGINRYRAEVPSDVRRLTIGPTVLDGYQVIYTRNPITWGVVSGCDFRGCHYSYGDQRTTGIVLADADPGTPGFQVDLDGGENRLGMGVNTGDVEAGPGSAYWLTVTVANVPASGEPAISGTVEVGQTLTAQTSGIADEDGLGNVNFSYQWIRVDEDSTESEIANATRATYRLVDADAGKTIRVRVDFADDAGNEQSLTSSATATVTEATALSADATLSGLALSGVSFGTFAAATTSYTARVNNSVTETTVTPTPNHSGANYAIRIGSTEDPDGTVSLSVGSNAVTVMVTAEDGLTTKTYTVTVTRLDADSDPISSDASLSGLTLSGIDYGTFVPGKTSYSASVANSVAQTTVTPTVNDSGATFATKLNGVTDSDGALPLRIGSSVITVEVTAEDESTKQTYTVTVTRADFPSTDATLQSLTVNGKEVGYGGKPKYWISSMLNFPNEVTEATVEATANHPGASYVIKVDGVIDDDGIIPLADPEPGNRFCTLYGSMVAAVDIEVTAEDGKTTHTYAIWLFRQAPRNDASLMSLELSGVDFGTFSSSTTEYTADVGATVTSTTVTPTLSYPCASYAIKLGGVEDDDGVISLAEGANVVTIEVTAEDGETVQTYTVTVTRQGSSSEPTGVPTISGTAQVGETLTVDTSAISDPDGLSNPSFEYQWIANDGTIDSDIAGGTGSTYLVKAEDAGKTIKVRVSFTDDGGNDEALTSAATAAVAATVPGVPRSVTVEQGGTGELDVTWEAPASNGGSDVTGYTVQWKEAVDSWDTPADVSEANTTDTSYTITSLSLGTEYSVRVIASNSVGDGPASAEVTETADAQTSQQVVAQNTPATGQPTISGIAQVGEPLTADTSAIADADGLTSVTFTYQWVRNDGNTDTDIEDATDSTYTLVSADEDKTIKVRVSFTDDASNSESLISGATVAIAGEVVVTIDVTPRSIKEGTEGKVTAEIAIGGLGGRTDEGREYYFSYDILDEEGESADDFCKPSAFFWIGFTLIVDPGIAPKHYVTTDEGKTFPLCPVGTYTLRLTWAIYETKVEVDSTTGTRHTTRGEYLTGGRVERTFEVIVNDDVDPSIEQVEYITPKYPDPPATHDNPLIIGAGSTIVRRGSPATFSLGIGGLAHYDSDPDTTDYVVSVRVVDEEGMPITACNKGKVGYSYLLKSDDRHGTMWNMYAHLSRICTSLTGPASLRTELLNGSYEYIIHSDIDFLSSGFTNPPRPNTPATGLPVISGTPRVGDTLTVDTSGINDAEGLSNVAYSYQWIDSLGTTDTDVSGATSTSYLVTADDVGKTLKVRVSFSDDASNDETLISEPTAAVLAAVPDAPTSIAVEQGGTGELDVSWEAPDSDGGAEITEYTVQWKETAGNWDADSDVSSANTTVTSYTITGLSVGTEYSVRVFATNSAGDGPASAEESATAEAQTSQQRAALQNTPATGVPTITGTAQVGETLTANTSGIADEDGLDNVSFSYQWLVDDTDIAGATTSTHTLTDSDEGRVFKVRVSFTDDAGNEESLTSAATAEVESPLTAELQNVPGSHDGSSTFTFRILFSEPVTVGFQALKEHSFQVSNATIRRAQRVDGRNDLRQFTVRPSSDVAVVLVLAADRSCDEDGAICTSDGKRLSNRLELTVSGPAGVNAPATGGPTIGGTARVGQTLTASTSGIADSNGLGDAAFSYQWIRSDGGTEAEIPGATLSTYALTDADEGKAIKVEVSFTDDAGYPETLTSAPTAAVEARPNTPASGVPTISGEAQVGQTLTADTSGISDEDGLDNATFSYRWLADDADISGATGSTYTLVPADESKAIKVQVSFVDDRGHDESQTSAATTAVSPAAPGEQEQTQEPTDRPHGLSAIVEASTVVLSWNAPDDAAAVTMYRILRHRPEEGETEPLVYVDYTHSRATSYTDTAVEPGTLYVYAVQASDGFGFVGEASHPAEVRVPETNTLPTGAPTISGEPQVGKTLTADTSGITDDDGLVNATFSYQWIANDGTADADIQGATASTYILSDADVGKAIKVRVSFTDNEGNQESLISAGTTAVEARPNSPATGSLSISGTAQVGETLTADTSGISDSDGLNNVTYNYQWLADDGDISGATGSTYALVSADEGKAIKVRVTFTDDAGNYESLTSDATGAVAAEETQVTEPPPAPTNLTAVLNGDGSVTLTWEAPDDDSVTGYQILRRRPPMGENTLLVYVDDTNSTATTYTDTDVTAGTRHVYRVKAINDAGLSSWSNYVRVEP